MGVVGELFAEELKQQILAREKFTASPRRGITNVPTLNRESWLRLSSGVNIQDPTGDEVPPSRLEADKKRVQELLDHYGVGQGDELARKMVLMGGVTGVSFDEQDGVLIESRIRQKGINRDPEDRYSGAYGFGGNKFGYRPMPGLSSAKIEYYNNGALRKADIQLTCYSPEQLDMLEILYLRPGYSILLEWGHVNYIDNNGEVQKFSLGLTPTSPFDRFFDQNTKSKDLVKAIKKEKEVRNYNYDAFYGTVLNFNWTFNTDNTYTVTIKAIAIGSVIESLRVNSSYSKGALQARAEAEAAARNTARAQSPGGRRLANFSEQPTTETVLEERRTLGPFSGIRNRAEQSQLFKKLTEAMDLVNDFNNQRSISEGGFATSYIHFLDDTKLRELFETNGGPVASNINIVKINWSVPSDEREMFGEDNGQYFITLAGLLELMERFQMVYDADGEGYITFDTTETPMFTFPGHFSGDPSVCFIPPEYIASPEVQVGGTVASVFSVNDGTIVFENGPVNFLKELGFVGLAQSPFSTQTNITLADGTDAFLPATTDVMKYFIADMMRVWVNFGEVYRAVVQNETDDGTVALADVLNTLLSDMKRVLGGVNEFEYKFDETTNNLTLYDRCSHIRNPYANERDLITTFRPYGVIPGVESTFFTNLAFQTELTNEFASQVAIGAQAGNTEIAENSTSFIEFNQGLRDRITPIKKRPFEPTDGSRSQARAEGFSRNVDRLRKLYFKIYPDTNPDWSRAELSRSTVETLTSLNYDYTRALVRYFVVTKELIPSPFFIPFDLQAEFIGLAGPKIYQKFSLQEDILPYTYKGKIDFLIVNITNEVSNNLWITKLNTIAIPVKRELPKSENLPVFKDRLPGIAYAGGATYGTETTSKTLTSGIPYTLNVSARTSGISQIYLHHTGGNGGAKAAIGTWERNSPGVSTGYVLERNGLMEQLYADTTYASHLGTGNPVNGNFRDAPNIPWRNIPAFAIGVEVDNYGMLTQQAGGTWVTQPLNAAGDRRTIPASDVSLTVDWRGNPKQYRQFKAWQKFPPAQVAALKNFLIAKCREYNIPFVWNADTYNQMFPPQNSAGRNTISEAAFRGTPGVYTHGSVRLAGRSDLGPAAEIVQMLKEVAQALK